MDIILNFPDDGKSRSRTNSKSRNGSNRRSRSKEPDVVERDSPINLHGTGLYIAADRFYEGRTIKETLIDRVCNVARQVNAQGAVLVVTPGCRIQPRTWTYARNNGVALLTFIYEQSKTFLWNLHVIRASFINGYWLEDLVGEKYSNNHITLKADATLSSTSPAIKNKLIVLDDSLIQSTSLLVRNEILKPIQKGY